MISLRWSQYSQLCTYLISFTRSTSCNHIIINYPRHYLWGGAVSASVTAALGPRPWTLLNEDRNKYDFYIIVLLLLSQERIHAFLVVDSQQRRAPWHAHSGMTTFLILTKCVESASESESVRPVGPPESAFPLTHSAWSHILIDIDSVTDWKLVTWHGYRRTHLCCN